MDEIRGEDFRKMWPNALARALREVFDLIEALDDQRRQVVKLANVTPQMLEAAETSLERSTLAHIQSLEAAQAEINSMHKQMLQRFDQERSKLDKQRADLIKKELAFEQERNRFNNMSLWKRVLSGW